MHMCLITHSVRAMSLWLFQLHEGKVEMNISEEATREICNKHANSTGNALMSLYGQLMWCMNLMKWHQIWALDVVGIYNLTIIQCYIAHKHLSTTLSVHLIGEMGQVFKQESFHKDLKCQMINWVKSFADFVCWFQTPIWNWNVFVNSLLRHVLQ